MYRRRKMDIVKPDACVHNHSVRARHMQDDGAANIPVMLSSTQRGQRKMKHTIQVSVLEHSATVEVEDVQNGRIFTMTDIVLEGSPVDGRAVITFDAKSGPSIELPPGISNDDTSFMELLVETRTEVNVFNRRNRQRMRDRHAEKNQSEPVSGMDRQMGMRNVLHDVEMFKTMSDMQVAEYLAAKGIVINDIRGLDEQASYPPGSLGHVLAGKTGRTTVLMAFSYIVEHRDIILPEMISSGRESHEGAAKTRKNMEHHIRSITRHAEGIGYVEHGPRGFGVEEMGKMEQQIQEIVQEEIVEMSKRRNIDPDLAAMVHAYIHDQDSLRTEVNRRVGDGRMSKQAARNLMRIVRTTAEPEVKGYAPERLNELGTGV